MSGLLFRIVQSLFILCLYSIIDVVFLQAQKADVTHMSIIGKTAFGGVDKSSRLWYNAGVILNKQKNGKTSQNIAQI